MDYESDTISSPWQYLDNLPKKETSLVSCLEKAVDVLTSCFEKYKPEEICVCFNGGKDCLVVLHLAYAMLKKLHPDMRMQAVYISEEDAFPQVTEFVQQSINRYYQ